jgi:hypothetical protein
MILIEFLLAPTVPSAPRPKKTARTTSSGSMSKSRRRQREVRHVVDDADGEVPAWAAGLGELVEDRRTIAGVNSFDERP